MLLWASSCSNRQWMVRHTTLSIEIGSWCHLQKRWSEGLFGGGAKQCPKNHEKCFKIYDAYLYGTVEEFVMCTLICFNRSQHAFELQGSFNYDWNEEKKSCYNTNISGVQNLARLI